MELSFVNQYFLFCLTKLYIFYNVPGRWRDWSWGLMTTPNITPWTRSFIHLFVHLNTLNRLVTSMVLLLYCIMDLFSFVLHNWFVRALCNMIASQFVGPQISEWMKTMEKDHPDVVTSTVYGSTYEKRNIKLLKVVSLWCSDTIFTPLICVGMSWYFITAPHVMLQRRNSWHKRLLASSASVF